MPFFLWLRFLTGQTLITLHRHHRGVQMRDVGREVACGRATRPKRPPPLAALFLDHDTRPSEAAIRAEMKDRVRRPSTAWPHSIAKCLALRRFEQLGRAEIATVLGISEAAAGKHYLRALKSSSRSWAGPDTGGLTHE